MKLYVIIIIIIIIIHSEYNSLFIAHTSIQDWDKNSVELANGQLKLMKHAWL